jgi:hypothetical protein
MNLISFEDLVPGATVRFTNIDSVLYLCVCDIIKVMCNKNGKRAHEAFNRITGTASAKTWGRVQNNSPISSEITALCRQYKFKGSGQGFQKVITMEGAMKLIMVLPGESAKAMRVQAADILTRYILGDESLTEEIKQNKQIGPVAACSNLARKAVVKASQYSEMPQVSYVYGTKTEAFPDLIKIGKSIDVGARLSSLNTACAPAPHYIIAVAPTFDADRDEALAHTFFSSTRREGEFFEVSPDNVKAFFTNHIMAQYQEELAEHIAKAQGDAYDE